MPDTWNAFTGDNVAFVHGPYQLTGTPPVSKIFLTSAEASEDARKWAALHRENRVVYKLVPVAYHRARTGRVEDR